MQPLRSHFRILSMYLDSKLHRYCLSNLSYIFLFLVMLILFTRVTFMAEAVLDKNVSLGSSGDYRSYTYDTMQNETVGIAKVTECPKIKLMNAKKFSLQKISPRGEVDIISDFTSRYSLTIVLGQCLHFPSWLEDVKCSRGIYICIYLKCQTTIDEVFTKFSRERYFCIQPISLNATIYAGQQGTIKHFLYEHYYNLTDYSVFLKDNGRKSTGIPILTRVASALVNVEKSSGGVRFMTLSDLPPAYQAKIRKHTSKSRSVRLSIPHSLDIKNVAMRQDPNSTVSKYCRMFEKVTCTSCRRVWLPVRSQFLVSREAINAIDIKEFNVATSLHGEYTWALLFNCFVKKLRTRRGAFVYPFIVCVR